MICFRCRDRDANPANLGLCDPCDDADPQAFALCTDVIGEVSSDRTTRDLLELPWRE
jgi:hypothetical protein